MEDTIYWVWLNMIPNLQPKKLAVLIEKFSSPKAVLEGKLKNFIERGIDKEFAEKIIKDREKVNPEKELKEIEKNNVTVTVLNDVSYPLFLKQIFDPPLLLYMKGSFTSSDNISISIVGSRKSTYYGENCVKSIGSSLVKKGFSIISGMARGIDTIAHKTAIENKGRTMAVLGSGLNVIYPPENRKLADKIAENGAVLSEFPMNEGPERYNFPRRNRIISGISLGTVVVEAGEKSGALITADFALEQGKEVFGVPGNINSSASRGVNQLIKKGAKLVENADDIIEEIKYQLPESVLNKAVNTSQQVLPMPALSDFEKRIFSLISAEPKHIDIITRQSGLKISEVSGSLVNLELKGLIKQISGKLFIKI